MHHYAQRFTLHSLHDCISAGSIQPKKMIKKNFLRSHHSSRETPAIPLTPLFGSALAVLG